jgi:hypothetical protein
VLLAFHIALAGIAAAMIGALEASIAATRRTPTQLLWAAVAVTALALPVVIGYSGTAELRGDIAPQVADAILQRPVSATMLRGLGLVVLGVVVLWRWPQALPATGRVAVLAGLVDFLRHTGGAVQAAGVQAIELDMARFSGLDDRYWVRGGDAADLIGFLSVLKYKMRSAAGQFDDVVATVTVLPPTGSRP